MAQPTRMISGRPGRPRQPFLPFQLSRVYAAKMIRAKWPPVRAHHASTDKQAADLFPGQAARAEILECAEAKGDQTLKRYWTRTRIKGSAKLFYD